MIFVLFLLSTKLFAYDYGSGWGSYNNYSYSRQAQPIVSLDLDPQELLNASFRIAARENRVEDEEKFLREGADINSKSDAGTTALMYAARFCHEKTLRFLIENKADPNLIDNDGRTALIEAAGDSCEIAVRLLLGTPGIRTRVRDHSGKMAIDYISSFSETEVGGAANTILRELRATNLR